MFDIDCFEGHNYYYIFDEDTNKKLTKSGVAP